MLSATEVSRNEIESQGLDKVLEDCRQGLGLGQEDVYLAHLVPVSPGDSPSEHMACVVRGSGGLPKTKKCRVSQLGRPSHAGGTVAFLV